MLNMVRLTLDRSAVFEHGRNMGLVPKSDTVDWGYLLHVQLMGLFGEKAPRPFWFEPGNTRHLVVLGYSPYDKEELRNDAEMFADPLVHSSVDWKTFAGKVIPRKFHSGQQFGFCIRACPVIRTNKDSVEKDAFLGWYDALRAAGQVAHTPRSAVYREWLDVKFGWQGAAGLESMRVSRFELAKLIRRGASSADGKRPVYTLTRPDVTMEGTFRVKDVDAFERMLTQGVGRHKPFGFGMLLLKRVE